MSMQRKLTKVARIYSVAMIDGEWPSKAVRVQMQVPASTANVWIRRAKDIGLIHDVPPRRNARALKIAEELGVEYDALVQAVNRHAAGQLRLR